MGTISLNLDTEIVLTDDAKLMRPELVSRVPKWIQAFTLAPAEIIRLILPIWTPVCGACHNVSDA